MAQKINKFVLTTALLCSIAAPNVKAADIETNTAHMQAMDKITGRVSEIDVPVNSLVRFGSFSILVRKCMTTPPEETPENKAFVDVVDDYNDQDPVNIFKGWMFSSSPALNAVEHPIYDVWLLSCVDKNLQGVKKLSAEELQKRDEIKMLRNEDERTKDKETLSDLDKMIKETLKEGADLSEEPPAEVSTKEVKPQTASEVVEVVVSTHEVSSENNDAPQALIQIETQTKPLDMDEEKTEATTITEEEDVIEFEDENGFVEEELSESE